MKRLNEFKGYTTSIGYDATRGTFDSVTEIHALLDHRGTGNDMDGHVVAEVVGEGAAVTPLQAPGGCEAREQERSAKAS
ncbi:hypothetical protein NKJ26_20165 [Mesorhizobium sp. M0152]|uniref:hypothetical protein n=1 Tax=Mesorhizobium sp. M0152 TaxID=2956898 RepID=UPI003337669C